MILGNEALLISLSLLVSTSTKSFSREWYNSEWESLLVSHSLLHEPDEVLLGLVEGVHGGLGTELALVAVSTRQPTLQCTGQH